jgi:hypothetical protein
LNTNTCLKTNNPVIQSQDIINIAPGEGQMPTGISKEKHWEAMAFPTPFPDGNNTFNTNRINEMVHGPCAHRCGTSEKGKLLQQCSILSMLCWMKAKDRFFVFLRLIEM